MVTPDAERTSFHPTAAAPAGVEPSGEDTAVLVELAAAAEEEGFVQLKLSGRISQELPWRMAVVRPVLLRQVPHVQV